MAQEPKALTEMEVQLNLSENETDRLFFDMHFPIVNHYQLHDGDGLLCKLQDAYIKRNKTTIDEDVLIDVRGERIRPVGAFQPMDVIKYDLKKYDSANLIIQRVLPRR